ncbi:hypothetical protein BLA29_003103 [Euroglyphus maynei]|uniref:EB domain-containing protein n=1 Tax=Euroglyphus maynei TaxID=6958 RepID=A0A1Y3APQ7_EURMA|nr:hypothetical protein BLA29_003103 [Euroglyphus maynei]
MSSFRCYSAIILQILFRIVFCQNIGIHELSHDYNLKKIDAQNVQKLASLLDTSVTYQYRYQPIPNTTVKYFLAKPWRLRYVEFHDRTHNVRILHRRAQIRFDRVRLKKEREFCRDNDECESGSCPSFYCACDRLLTPVWLERAQICLETRNINDSCHDHAQCQWNGGPEAECYNHQWSRCRCRNPSVAIKISSTQYHCVRLGF